MFTKTGLNVEEDEATTLPAVVRGIFTPLRDAFTATALVTHTERIAEGFLKKAGVKLSKAKRNFTQSVHRHESFAKGEVDSKDIDINQKSLAGPAGKGSAGGKQRAR